MELLRYGLIGLSLIGFVATYGLLVRRAFLRDVLWGFFAVFGPPVGGWWHAFTDHLNGRRAVLLNVCCVLLAAATLLVLPQPRLAGYWATADRSYIVRLEPDGRIRNFDIALDARYSFRDIKVGNREISLRSATRLAFQGLGAFTVGYYEPRENRIDLYTTAADPERGLRPDLPDQHRRLERLREPLDETAAAAIATMEAREAVLAAVRSFFAQPSRPPLGPSVVTRYAANVAGARAWDAATLARQPFPVMVETLRLRAVHGAGIRAGATAAELLRRDLAEDGFRIRKLTAYEPYDVRLYPGERQAYIGFRRTTETGEIVYDQLSAERLSGGLWGLDVDWHLLLNVPARRPDGSPRSLDEAMLFLRDHYGLTPSPAWLQPIE